MNRYGRQAMRHWRQFDPDRYQAIPDPETFFSQLGEEVMAEIDARARSLEGADRPGEDFLEKTGRLKMARQIAESEILRERVLIASPEDEADEETPADGISGEMAALRRQLRQEEQDEIDAETTRDHRLNG